MPSMKALANDNEPEVEKHTNDYKLMWDYFFKTFQNKEYEANMRDANEYLNAPDDKNFGGKYGVV